MRKSLVTVLVLIFISMPALAKEVTITILATTDIHGNVSGYDYASEEDLGYGLLQAATQVKNMHQERKNLILVDLGDALSGNALPFYHKHFQPEAVNPVIAVMNEMKYDVAVPGNHDFDFGVEHFLGSASQSRFSWTSANILPAGDDTPLMYDSVIVERNGVKVGFFGLTTPVTARTLPPALITDVLFTDMVQAAQKAVTSLKQQGANVIIGLAHSGRGDKVQEGELHENAVYQVIENVPGITAMLCGHSHEEISFELYNNVLICQPGAFGQSIGVLMIDMQQRDGAWEVLAKTSTTLQVSGLKPERKAEKVARSLIGDCKDFADESLGDYDYELIFSGDPTAPGSATFMMIDAIQAWAASDVVMLPMQAPEETIKGRRAAFRNRHMLQLTPYDNHMVRFQVNGQALDQMMEKGAAMLTAEGTLRPGIPPYHFDYFGGVQYRMNPGAPAGERVEIVSVNRNTFAADAVYTVAMTGYEYGMGRYFTGDAPEPLEWSENSLRQMIRSLVLDAQEKEENSEE